MKKLTLMKNFKKTFGVLLFASLFTCWGQHQYEISFQGKGVVLATPDRIHFRVAVEEYGKELIPLKKVVTEKMSDALQICLKTGVDKKNLQTGQLVIEPVMEYHNQKRFRSGYRINQSLYVLLEKPESYDALLTDLLLAGINEVKEVSFKSSKQKELEKKALKLAIQNAKSNALFVSKEAGFQLGSLVDYSEDTFLPIPIYRAESMMMASESYDQGPNQGPSIALGQMKIQKTVSLVYTVETNDR